MKAHITALLPTKSVSHVPFHFNASQKLGVGVHSEVHFSIKTLVKSTTLCGIYVLLSQNLHSAFVQISSLPA